MGWTTIIVELVGGLAVLLGAFAQWVSIPLSAILLVSIFSVLLPNGFTSIKLLAITSAGIQLGKPGYEVDLLYLACLTMMVLGGTGPLSLDLFLAKHKASIDRTQCKCSQEDSLTPFSLLRPESSTSNEIMRIYSAAPDANLRSKEIFGSRSSGNPCRFCKSVSSSAHTFCFSAVINPIQIELRPRLAAWLLCLSTVSSTE